MKLSKKELEKRSLEYRAVFMDGYTKGYKAATPMGEFVGCLAELMDMKMVDKIRKWSEEEYNDRKSLLQKITKDGYEKDELLVEVEELKIVIEKLKDILAHEGYVVTDDILKAVVNDGE